MMLFGNSKLEELIGEVAVLRRQTAEILHRLTPSAEGPQAEQERVVHGVADELLSAIGESLEAVEAEYDGLCRDPQCRASEPQPWLDEIAAHREALRVLRVFVRKQRQEWDAEVRRVARELMRQLPMTLLPYQLSLERAAEVIRSGSEP